MLNSMLDTCTSILGCARIIRLAGVIPKSKHDKKFGSIILFLARLLGAYGIPVALSVVQSALCVVCVHQK